MGLANAGSEQANADLPRIAPEGFLWVCMACGKTVRDRYGEEGGWDESCFLNSQLHPIAALRFGSTGRVEHVDPLPVRFRIG